jgi:hypothetical protein
MAGSVFGRRAREPIARAVIESAIETAVKEERLWLISGPAIRNHVRWVRHCSASPGFVRLSYTYQLLGKQSAAESCAKQLGQWLKRGSA